MSCILSDHLAASSASASDLWACVPTVVSAAIPRPCFPVGFPVRWPWRVVSTRLCVVWTTSHRAKDDIGASLDGGMPRTRVYTWGLWDEEVYLTLRTASIPYRVFCLVHACMHA